MAISTKDLRENLLDRRIEAIKDAIGRARTTWLFATLLTFVVAAAIFNATVGFTKGQIERRATLVGAVSGSTADITAIMNNPQSKEAPFITRIFRDGTGELGYLRKLLPIDADGTDTKTEKLKALRAFAAQELQEHIKRRVTFDSVQIPLLGIAVAASDIGIVGGVGLAIVGYWLLAVLRRENHAFGAFIQRPDGTSRFETDHSGYSVDESAYAYHAVSQYMVFSVSKKDSPMNYITFAGFLIPPALILFNHLATSVMLTTRTGVGDYFEPRVLTELLVAVAVGLIWGRALFYQLDTVHALQAWSELAVSGSKRK